MKVWIGKILMFLVSLYMMTIGLASAFIITSNLVNGSIRPWSWPLYWQLNGPMYLTLLTLPGGIALATIVFRRKPKDNS